MVSKSIDFDRDWTLVRLLSMVAAQVVSEYLVFVPIVTVTNYGSET